LLFVTKESDLGHRPHSTDTPVDLGYVEASPNMPVPGDDAVQATAPNQGYLSVFKGATGNIPEDDHSHGGRQLLDPQAPKSGLGLLPARGMSLHATMRRRLPGRGLVQIVTNGPSVEGHSGVKELLTGSSLIRAIQHQTHRS